MKRLLLLLNVIAAIVIVAGSAVSIPAQDNKIVQVSKEEEAAVKKIEGAKTVEEKVAATEAFIQKYPKSPARDQAAGYLAGQISQLTENGRIISNSEKYLAIFNEPGESDLILPALVFAYVEQNRQKEAFSTAEKYLARNPGDVTIRLRLAAEGANMSRQGNNEFSPAAREYAQKAIELIEADQKPANLNAEQWSEYRTKWLPQLYQSRGLIMYSTDSAKARADFEKSARLAPQDVNNWIMLGSLVHEEYLELAKKHSASTSPEEQKELLNQANNKLDQVIRIYARILALIEGNASMREIEKQIRPDLESYYKFRNKSSTEGLQELINKHKTELPLN